VRAVRGQNRSTVPSSRRRDLTSSVTSAAPDSARCPLTNQDIPPYPVCCRAVIRVAGTAETSRRTSACHSSILLGCLILDDVRSAGGRSRTLVSLSRAQHSSWLCNWPPGLAGQWLGPRATAGDLLSLLRPPALEEALTSIAVSSDVSNARNQGPDCVRPFDADSA
jgi:hypothetical protein